MGRIDQILGLILLKIAEWQPFLISVYCTEHESYITVATSIW